MARKMMTKEVTKTVVKIGTIKVDENGVPVMETLPEVILIGNVTMEKAQKAVNKKYDHPVTVFAVEAETEVYEMAVADFIKYAQLKVEGSEETTDEETAEVA